ncbi:MAG: hypothetical protein U0804_13635 [Gemmataceae bacterium]
MSTTADPAAPPLSLARVDFADLYARHLCRHSQFGINLAHLAALFGVWFGVYGLLYRLLPEWWVPGGLAALYLLAVVPNLPPRVTLALAAFLALFVAAVVFAPALPLWAYPLLVPVCYKLQAWSHKVFTTATDMTEFDRRYPKGQPLFWVLLFYEVPFLLNYLVFDRRRWAA